MSQFTPTPYTNLLRSTSTEVYFLNAKVSGKLYRYSLETTDAKTAQAKRDEELKTIKDSLEAGNDGRGSLTLAEALKLHHTNLKERQELEGKSSEGISPKTLACYESALDKLQDVVPAADLQAPLRKLTVDNLKSWLRPVQKEYSATYYNACVIVLRGAFEIGLKKAACRTNPAEELKTTSSNKKDIELPSIETFRKLVQTIRDGGNKFDGLEVGAQKEILRELIANFKNTKGEVDFTQAFKVNPSWQAKLGLSPDATAQDWQRVYALSYYVRRMENNVNRRGNESADMVEFLAYTGARVEETRALTWDKIDFAKGLITFSRDTVKGRTRTKVVPIHPALVPVLRACQERQNADQKVFSIASCRKAIQSACAKLKIKPLSHHSFRHLFGTLLLEAGVPVAVVATLMGHSDNGRTLLTRYTHASAVRNAHVIHQLDLGTSVPISKADEKARLLAQLAALEVDEAPDNVVTLKA